MRSLYQVPICGCCEDAPRSSDGAEGVTGSPSDFLERSCLAVAVSLQVPSKKLQYSTELPKRMLRRLKTSLYQKLSRVFLILTEGTHTLSFSLNVDTGLEATVTAQMRGKERYLQGFDLQMTSERSRKEE